MTPDQQRALDSVAAEGYRVWVDGVIARIDAKTADGRRETTACILGAITTSGFTIPTEELIPFPVPEEIGTDLINGVYYSR